MQPALARFLTLLIRFGALQHKLTLRLENDALVYEIREKMYKTKQDDMTVAQYLVVFGKN